MRLLGVPTTDVDSRNELNLDRMRAKASWRLDDSKAGTPHAMKQCSFFYCMVLALLSSARCGPGVKNSLQVVVGRVCCRRTASGWICGPWCRSGVVRVAVAALVTNHMEVHLWDLVAVVAEHPNLVTIYRRHDCCFNLLIQHLPVTCHVKSCFRAYWTSVFVMFHHIRKAFHVHRVSTVKHSCSL